MHPKLSMTNGAGSSPPLMVLLCTLLGLLSMPSVTAQETVRAKLGEKSVWMGQAVPLWVTLYSPGPFSGTASFDLPKIPGTVVVKAGTPLVGNEDVDGVSYFTQQHEFTIYTQQTGEVVIPAFRIRFSGKKTFTSEPEAMEGVTPELRFQSRRPPGTEQLELLVSATELTVTQSWKPEATTPIKAGDIVARTILQRASGTTAMMITPVTGDAPIGVRVYLSDPIVKDQNQRGETTAERIETIKYQFEQAGTYQLPEMSFAWWDIKAGDLKNTVLPGRSFTVEGPLAASEASSELPVSGPPRAGWLLAFFLVGLVAIWLAIKFWKTWRLRRNQPEERAARRLLAACHANAPAEAYTALVQWERFVCAVHRDIDVDALASFDDSQSFEAERAALARHLFAAASPRETWSGQALAVAFAQTRRRHRLTKRQHHETYRLPQLNP